MIEVPVVPALVTLAASSLAAWTDLRGFRIPNRLTLPLFASGLVYHAALGGGPFLGSLLGALFGGGILLLPFLLGGMGAGDVKLLAGLGAWLGVPGIVYVFIVAGLAGGGYALLLIALGRPHEEAAGDVEQAVRGPGRRRRLVPFAVMILIGTIAVLLYFSARPGEP